MKWLSKRPDADVALASDIATGLLIVLAIMGRDWAMCHTLKDVLLEEASAFESGC